MRVVKLTRRSGYRITEINIQFSSEFNNVSKDVPEINFGVGTVWCYAVMYDRMANVYSCI